MSDKHCSGWHALSLWGKGGEGQTDGTGYLVKAGGLLEEVLLPLLSPEGMVSVLLTLNDKHHLVQLYREIAQPRDMINQCHFAIGGRKENVHVS